MFKSICLASLVGFAGCLVVSAAQAAPSAYVRVSPRDARYFELSDGSPYIPIGLNLIAPPGKEGLPGMEAWMRAVSSNGGNYIRVWLSNPFFDIEPLKSGQYDEAKAAHIEQMLALADRYGIRVKMCLEHFRHLGDGKQTWAGKPLHHVSQGGTATNIADFFNGEPSRKLFQQKLAWYANRFGNRPTIFGWELWNEINAVSGGDYMAWTEVMLPELHRLFPKNLAMQSLGSFDTDRVRPYYQRLARMPGNDVAQVHRYLDLGAKLEACKGPVDVLAVDAAQELLTLKPGKPVILAESGAVEPSHAGPFKLYPNDTAGILFHDVLFAPFFAGAAGPGHIWHWDHYVAKMKLWHHLGSFAEAVRGIDPPAEKFAPLLLPHERLRVYVLKGQKTTLLWCRDSQNTWQTELAEGHAPVLLKGLTLNMQSLNLPKATARIFDPWSNHWAPVSMQGNGVALPEFSRSLVIRLETK